MSVNQETIEKIVRQVLANQGAVPSSVEDTSRDPFLVPVGVSNRHIHLSREDMDALFGPGSELHKKKDMKQPGQYAADEVVTLRGPKGSLSKVRVLGPFRKETQIELSVADGFAVGIKPPLRLSGHLENSPGLDVIGPNGTVHKDHGAIVAMRHIHMLPEKAEQLGIKNGDVVNVEIDGPRGGVMHEVVIRAAPNSAFEMHVDVEEANAFSLKNDDCVRIVKC